MHEKSHARLQDPPCLRCRLWIPNCGGIARAAPRVASSSKAVVDVLRSVMMTANLYWQLILRRCTPARVVVSEIADGRYIME
jgi:hypothetical protein